MGRLESSAIDRVFPDEILGVGRSSDPFPLLLKYLDCNRDLSLQVHPDDHYARGMVPPDLAKPKLGTSFMPIQVRKSMQGSSQA